jgi:hypothetical protein
MSVTITPAGGSTFRFHGYTRVDWDVRVQVSDHPIEKGAEVSDHAQRMPVTFTEVGIVTETPFDTADPAAVEKAIAFLSTDAIGKLCTVDIPRDGVFEDCLITSVRHTQDSKRARTFDVGFKVVTIASAVDVTIPPTQPKPVAAAGAPDATDAGTQTTTPVDAAPVADKSWLASGQDFSEGLADWMFGMTN